MGIFPEVLSTRIDKVCDHELDEWIDAEGKVRISYTMSIINMYTTNKNSEAAVCTCTVESSYTAQTFSVGEH